MNATMTFEIGGSTPGKSTTRTQTLPKLPSDAQGSAEDLTGTVLGLVDGAPETLSNALATLNERILRDKVRYEQTQKQAQERLNRITERCKDIAGSDLQLTGVAIARQLSSEFVLTEPEAFAILKTAIPDRVERDKQRHEELRREQIASEEAAKADAKRQELITKWWPEHVGRFAACRLDNFQFHGARASQAKQRSHLEQIRQLDILSLIEQGKNILFIGPAGTGKDHLMHALAFNVLERLGKGVKAYNGAQLRSDLRKATLDSAAKEAELIQSLVKADLLMLSDPVPTGSKSLSDYQADALYHIVDQRWSKSKPIWATLNLPVDETLKESAIAALTAPVYDRLRDNSIVIICSWESYRKADSFIV